MPRLAKIIEDEEAASEREEKRRKKEERRAEIMANFEADKITGDDAEKRLEELDDKFGLLESGPERSEERRVGKECQ